MRRQRISKFLFLGEKKSSGNVVITNPERPEREGQHLLTLVLARRKMKRSLAWSGSLSTQGMEWEVLWRCLVLKGSGKLVENLCLQCKYEVLYMVSVYQGFIVLWSGWRAHKSCNRHGTLGINPNRSKREDLDEECLQKVGWEWASWEGRCRLAQGRNQWP